MEAMTADEKQDVQWDNNRLRDELDRINNEIRMIETGRTGGTKSKRPRKKKTRTRTKRTPPQQLKVEPIKEKI
jgi:hypothetical protein